MKEFVREIQQKGYKELHVQVVPLYNDTPVIFAEKIRDVMKRYSLHIIRATFFGDLKAKNDTIEQLDNSLNGIDFPFSWIEGENCTDSFINGAYFFAVTDINVKRIYHQDIITASYFQTVEAEYCFLAGLCSDNALSPSQQTEDILNSAEKILITAGLNFKNTVRTWFFLDDILEWYTEFNSARTTFFNSHQLSMNQIPASTGIGGKNVKGSKICLELIAVKPKNQNFFIDKVNSPLQCSALNYGSSFSRAIRYGDDKQLNLTISGTASIDPEGNTMHINDIEKQIELTFKVIREILESQDFKFNDITRAYAYFRNKSTVNGFQNLVRKNVNANVLFICTGNEICRDDLLFEVDIDAAKSQQQPGVEQI